MTMRLLPRAALLSVAGLSFLAGCSRAKDSSTGDSAGAVRVAFGDDSARHAALGPDDVRIVSTDGVLVLSLIGDTVRMHLSDSLRNAVGAEIARDVDTSGDVGGLGGIIAKSVSKVVTGAMGVMVNVPATDVQNLRFENGHIRFEVRNSAAKVKLSGDAKEKAVFTEEDAHRFIDAVKRKSERAIAM